MRSSPAPNVPPRSARPALSPLAHALLVFSLVLAAYWPALWGDVLWDDFAHLTRPDLRSLDGLRRIWFEIGATQQYYPLLHSAFWLEHKLWGDSTLGYHLVNVFLHGTAACLFAAVLRRLLVTGSARRGEAETGAAFAALVFALHPVCVESVAWISEQKNTLSAVFYLGAALAFLRWRSVVAGVADPGRSLTEPGHIGPKSAVPGYATPSSRLVAGVAAAGGGFAEPGATSATAPAWERGRPRPQLWYALATFLFLCALLTKTVTATLPAALLVVLWWRHGRLAFRRDVLPLVPWFVLGAASGLLTAWFERKLIGAEGADFTLTLLERALLAGRVVWFYLGKLLWPVELTFVYPRWTVDATVWWQWLFPLAALALLFALWRFARSASRPAAGVRDHAPGLAAPTPRLSDPPPSSRNSQTSSPSSQLPTLSSGLSRLCPRARRAPLAAALLFGGTLFPVLGFFNVYPFVFSYVADHFQYLAMLSVLALIAATLTTVFAALPRALVYALAGGLVLLLGTLTHRQARDYRDEPTLYRATLERNPHAWLAHNNLATLLINADRREEALPHLEASLRLNPDSPQTLANLGGALAPLGRAQEALPYLYRAIELQPGYPDAHNNLGVALVALERLEEAVPFYQRAVELRPDYANAQFNLAVALARLQRRAEAVPHFQRAVALRPDHVEAQLGLAVALASTGRFAEAEPHFERAVALAPENVLGLRSYARALAAHDRLERALPLFRRVAELSPQSPDAHRDLADALDELGQPAEAQRHHAEAQRLGPP